MISQREAMMLDPETYGMPRKRRNETIAIPVRANHETIGFIYETAGGFWHSYRFNDKKDMGSFRSCGSAIAWVLGE